MHRALAARGCITGLWRTLADFGSALCSRQKAPIGLA